MDNNELKDYLLSLVYHKDVAGSHDEADIFMDMCILIMRNIRHELTLGTPQDNDQYLPLSKLWPKRDKIIFNCGGYSSVFINIMNTIGGYKGRKVRFTSKNGLHHIGAEILFKNDWFFCDPLFVFCARNNNHLLSAEELKDNIQIVEQWDHHFNNYIYRQHGGILSPLFWKIEYDEQPSCGLRL